MTTRPPPVDAVLARLNAAVQDGTLTIRRSGLFGIYAVTATNGAAWDQVDGPSRGLGPCAQLWRYWEVRATDGTLTRFREADYLRSLRFFAVKAGIGPRVATVASAPLALAA